ncbi:uncharacterized protein LOC107046672 [Diachasma alloeum]|uniref:uncharacterized protein LOC107046672 n=1 Tax=Diachasma alloeum TaxID=454923 RepID=UPI000738331B|nr:uncharacterized protein LOC107046672 [Diachasma alloeum]
MKMAQNNYLKNSKRGCCVPQCKVKDNLNLSFHSFPSDLILRNKWMKALKLRGIYNENMKVCSQHFSLDDYIKRHDGCIPKNRRLKKNVIPSFNFPSSASSSNSLCDQGDLVFTSISYGNSKRYQGQEHVRDHMMHDVRELDEETNCIGESGTVLPVASSDLMFERDATWQTCVMNEDVAVQVDIQKPKMDSASQACVLTCVAAVSTSIVKVDAGVQVNLLGIKAIHKETQTNNATVDQFIEGDEKVLNAFTGLSTFRILALLTLCVTQLRMRVNPTVNDCLTVREKIILVFMKLKINLSYIGLSAIFKVSPNTCKNYFINTINDLAHVLKTVVRWPEKKEILQNLPKCFEGYRKTRVVLDCTEIPITKSKCLKCRFPTYSHYKGRQTIKFLLGISPSGLISFVSKAYGGRASDKQIFSRSKILEKMIPSIDSVMVDKGFLIDAECARYGIGLIRPPYLRKNRRFTRAEAESTARIAAARVHVERTIQRVKIFKIMEGILPQHLVKYSDDIMTVICGITNLSRPILSADKFSVVIEQPKC